MIFPKPLPIESIGNLRDRVERLLKKPVKSLHEPNQLSFDMPLIDNKNISNINHPSKNIAEFLNFITDAMPDGDVYLFGGILRDMALLGRRGFNSDIDLVVDGNWSNFVNYLEFLNAHKNKFGGYRLMVGEWPVDIWNARETWAIKKGLVEYKGIASLTETTVLNWDAILMNWRTRNFIYRKNYIDDINSMSLDIVLEKNPNPLGMAIRVFRHLCLKNAKKITPSAANYLAKCAKKYTYEEIRKGEISSYGNNVIHTAIYSFFKHINTSDDQNIKHQFNIASNLVKRELDLNNHLLG